MAIDNQRAWRVSVGSCTAGGATLATTTDGGKTWVDAKTPLRTIVRVRSTTSAGSSWADSGEVTGAMALSVSSADPAQTYVARVGVPDCPGIQIQRVDQSVATSCIHTVVPTDPGQIALSLVKGGGWLAIGHSTMRSTDELVSWSAS